MDFKYNNTRFGQTAGQSLYGTALTNTYSSFGNQDAGGLYGAGRFGYSINDTSSAGLSIATASVSFSDVNFNADYVVTGSYRKFTVTTARTTLADADFLAVRSFVVSGSGVNFATNLVPEFTKYDEAANTVTFIVSGSLNSVLQSVTYSKQPTSTARGDGRS